MLDPLIATLATRLSVWQLIPVETAKTWAVFILCLLLSLLGVGLSFVVLGTTLKGYPLWGAGFVIAVLMLGVTYAAKYLDVSARKSFTPVDFIQYLGQGFLWPSTWPGLAKAIGVDVPDLPKQGSFIVDALRSLLTA